MLFDEPLQRGLVSRKLENWSFWAVSVQKWGQNGQKCPKSKVFRICSKTAYWISLIFCMNARLRECKKVTFLFFSGKLENWSFWAASVQKWGQNGQKCPKSKVFRICSKTAYWISLIFCMNASLRECKKLTSLGFSAKFEN